jgi:hypothetical protein
MAKGEPSRPRQDCIRDFRGRCAKQNRRTAHTGKAGALGTPEQIGNERLQRLVGARLTGEGALVWECSFALLMAPRAPRWPPSALSRQR